MAAGVISAVGLVKAQQWTDDKKKKGQYMFYHKSFGLLMMGMIFPRVALRLRSTVPSPPPGSVMEQFAGKLSHFALYTGMIVLPISGVLMGYYGGKGLPFFFTTIPGATKENRKKSVAKNAYKLHKQVGNVFQYIIPIHIGAVGFHYFRGQNLLARINPFTKP
jgi:1,2-dihydroxy-3-keto-5-methylthiopentene dioxygenase